MMLLPGKPFHLWEGPKARHITEHMTLRKLFLLVALAAAAFGPRVVLSQTDVIRGRLTGPDSTGLEGATVTATSLSCNVNRTAKTDSPGRFSVPFPGADVDYILQFA